jgi:hypothetical protein
MSLAQNAHTISVSTGGNLEIIVTQESSNWASNTSQVTVTGRIGNVGVGGSTSSSKDIPADIGGEQSFTGPHFGFALSPGDSITFVEHTFTVVHDSDGNKVVTFDVHYGSTGTAYFGSEQTVSVVLTLIRIPIRPAPPGTPTFSNERPTSLTVSWAGSPNNGGNLLDGYQLRIYKGSGTSGPFSGNFAANLSRNLTGLTPGGIYTFTVLAKNDAADNGGYSNPSGSATIQMFGGSYVRSGGVWKAAIPYVRSGGTWRLAVPYVRSGGAWKLTE